MADRDQNVYKTAKDLDSAVLHYLTRNDTTRARNSGAHPFENKVWTLKRVDENLWNLEDRFIFTDSAFQEIHWTGFVTPQATFREMLVDVSVEGETVTYMLNQIVSTISEPMD